MEITKITANSGGTSFNGQGLIKVPAVQFVSEAREVQVTFEKLQVNDAYCVMGGKIEPIRDTVIQKMLEGVKK